ncbi:MAG: hypothetical protein LBS79_00585 [Tannerella sp.]|jgi:hypothetical protein|nr:hypothetical protein [Tannerella sp.]
MKFIVNCRPRKKSQESSPFHEKRRVVTVRIASGSIIGNGVKQSGRLSPFLRLWGRVLHVAVCRDVAESHNKHKACNKQTGDLKIIRGARPDKQITK